MWSRILFAGKAAGDRSSFEDVVWMEENKINRRRGHIYSMVLADWYSFMCSAACVERMRRFSKHYGQNCWTTMGI